MVFDVVRRVRNSLGHGLPNVRVSPDATSGYLLDKVTLKFHDVNLRDAADTLDVELSLGRLVQLVKKFQSAIHRHVREKTSPNGM